MPVSDAVRMALAKARKKQTQLANLLGVSVNAVYMKMSRDNWSAADLLHVAEATGGKLAFVYPDGQKILIEAAEETPDGGESD